VRLRQADVAGRFASARELGGDLHDFLAPEPNSLVIAVGDVSGKGAPAAYYSPATNTKHVVYLGTDGHLHDLWWVPEIGTPAPVNLTHRAGLRGSGSNAAAFALSAPPTEHVVLRLDGSIWELLW